MATEKNAGQPKSNAAPHADATPQRVVERAGLSLGMENQSAVLEYNLGAARAAVEYFGSAMNAFDEARQRVAAAYDAASAGGEGAASKLRDELRAIGSESQNRLREAQRAYLQALQRSFVDATDKRYAAWSRYMDALRHVYGRGEFASSIPGGFAVAGDEGGFGLGQFGDPGWQFGGTPFVPVPNFGPNAWNLGLGYPGYY